MDLKKLKVDWKRVLITAGIVLLSALVVGGTTWYIMDKSSREVVAANEASVSSLQKQIDALEQTAATKKETPTEEETPTVTPVASGATTLAEYCKTANGGLLLPGYSYMKTVNGEYANCGIGSLEMGGAMLIAKFENGAWAKLWSGNGVIETSVCDADKIPNKMSGGTCNY